MREDIFSKSIILAPLNFFFSKGICFNSKMNRQTCGTYIELHHKRLTNIIAIKGCKFLRTLNLSFQSFYSYKVLVVYYDSIH